MLLIIKGLDYINVVIEGPLCVKKLYNKNATSLLFIFSQICNFLMKMWELLFGDGTNQFSSFGAITNPKQDGQYPPKKDYFSHFLIFFA